MLSPLLKNKDNEKKDKADAIRNTAWCDHQETTDEQNQPLDALTVIGKMTDECGRYARHADERGDRRVYKLQRRCLNHQKHG